MGVEGFTRGELNWGKFLEKNSPEDNFTGSNSPGGFTRDEFSGHLFFFFLKKKKDICVVAEIYYALLASIKFDFAYGWGYKTKPIFYVILLFNIEII